MATIRDRRPLAVIPVYDIHGRICRYVVALQSHTSGYVVIEADSLDDTGWSGGWYYEAAPDAVRAAAFRALHGPLSWEMIQAMTGKGCLSR